MDGGADGGSVQDQRQRSAGHADAHQRGATGVRVGFKTLEDGKKVTREEKSIAQDRASLLYLFRWSGDAAYADYYERVVSDAPERTRSAPMPCSCATSDPKLAQEAIARMRQADYDIEVGRGWFDFVCEYLSFLALAADRIAHAGAQGRYPALVTSTKRRRFLHTVLNAKGIRNPVLSFVGRLFFKIPVGDFHCGLRGFRTEALRALELRTAGMEFGALLDRLIALSLEGRPARR
mgnify:CR=1 FL=1